MIIRAYNDVGLLDSEPHLFTPESNGRVYGVLVEVGHRVVMRDYVYHNLMNNTNIESRFKLNVRRVNRWWYSVYFDKKGESK